MFLTEVFSVKDITDIATKHGLVGAGFKPAQDVSGTNQVNFPPQGGFETRPYKNLRNFHRSGCSDGHHES